MNMKGGKMKNCIAFIVIMLSSAATAGKLPMMMPYGAATVDGDLNDWRDVQWYALDTIFDGNPDDARDAKMAVKWTENMVYMAVTYTDTDFQFSPSRIDWNGQDSLEVYVDATNSNAYAYEGQDSYLDHDQATEWVCGPVGDKAGTVSPGWTGGIWKGMGYFADMGHTDYLAAVNVQGSRITYELGLPSYSHRTRGELATLALGQTIGCDAAIVTKSSIGYGMLCANNVPQKCHSAGRFQDWMLVPEPGTMTLLTITCCVVLGRKK